MALRTLTRLRRRRRPVVFWTVVATLAAVTGTVVARTAADAEAALDRYGTRVRVAVVARAVPVGAVLAPEDVVVREVPVALVPVGALGEVPVGRTAVVALVEGEVVVAERIAPGGLSGPSALLPAGTAGVTVARGEASPPLALGDAVDVVATFAPSGAGPGTTAVVANAARVVHVDEAAVTLAVPSGDAARVASAHAEATVSLVLSADRSRR